VVEKALPNWVQGPDAQLRDILGWAYAYVREHLRTYVKKRCPSDEEADDVLLDTAIRLVGAVKRISSKSHLLRYAETIARNILSTRIRGARRPARARVRVEAYHDDSATEVEMRELVANISRYVTASQLDLFQSLYVKGKSDDQCARELGLTPESFRARKCRLHRTLRKWVPLNYR
jgi:RNA polymerase sigma factor (sigma-70 family)